MYHVEKLNGAARFVCLQMSNQVPSSFISSYFWDLRFRFLNTILPEIGGSKLDNFPDYACGMGSKIS